MGYGKTMQLHLATYKRNRLGIKEAGVFRHKGVEKLTPHVLPLQLKWLNILEPIRLEVREFVKGHRDIRLHKYFHHLNSSQAFALNLFFPFFEWGTASVLLRAMGLSTEITKWHLEHVPDKAEGTNVDVSWQGPGGGWTFCEVKLTEQEFGKAADDKRHRHKLAKIYSPVLAPHCPAEFVEPGFFFEHYQILRNVWLAARDQSTTVVFLYPARNDSLTLPLHRVLDGLRPSLRSRVHVVTVEELLRKVAAEGDAPAKLKWYVELLAEKYVPATY